MSFSVADPEGVQGVRSKSLLDKITSISWVFFMKI